LKVKHSDQEVQYPHSAFICARPVQRTLPAIQVFQLIPWYFLYHSLHQYEF